MTAAHKPSTSRYLGRTPFVRMHLRNAFVSVHLPSELSSPTSHLKSVLSLASRLASLPREGQKNQGIPEMQIARPRTVLPPLHQFAFKQYAASSTSVNPSARRRRPPLDPAATDVDLVAPLVYALSVSRHNSASKQARSNIQHPTHHLRLHPSPTPDLQLALLNRRVPVLSRRYAAGGS